MSVGIFGQITLQFLFATVTAGNTNLGSPGVGGQLQVEHKANVRPEFLRFTLSSRGARNGGAAMNGGARN